jgi:mono/diheme cytochrome c family protein
MRRFILWGTVAVLVVGLLAAFWLRGSGITARRDSWPGEERLARTAWRFMVPTSTRDAANPVADTPEALSGALEHFADHCALCHANDGSGETTIGRSVYPPVPDLRAARTQTLSDGELFYAIEQGIPWTAMPAWGTGTKEGGEESWKLVRFIRHLPKITSDELTRMEALNPRSSAEQQRDKAIDDFLGGGKPSPPKAHTHK